MGARDGSLLPRTLLVAIRLQALSALVLVHLQTTFLFQISHGDLEGMTVLLASEPVKLILRRLHPQRPLPTCKNNFTRYRIDLRSGEAGRHSTIDVQLGRVSARRFRERSLLNAIGFEIEHRDPLHPASRTALDHHTVEDSRDPDVVDHHLERALAPH